jgi:hypothetical protein
VAIHQGARFSSSKDAYEQALTWYRAAATEQEAYELGIEARRLHAEARSASRSRDFAMYALAGLAVASVLDAWRSPPGGFRLESPTDSDISIRPMAHPGGAGVAFSVRF